MNTNGKLSSLNTKHIKFLRKGTFKLNWVSISTHEKRYTDSTDSQLRQMRGCKALTTAHTTALMIKLPTIKHVDEIAFNRSPPL